MIVRSGFSEQGVREEDELVAAEETGTRAGGNVEQGHPRESEIPPQPAGRRRKRAHAVMAAAVHIVSIITLSAMGRQWRKDKYQVPGT